MAMIAGTLGSPLGANFKLYKIELIVVTTL
jgi:hypothetical protein